MPTIELSKGATEYELQGPPSGDLVVLLHGGSIPMWTWDQVVPGLVAAGFRTLRYDMYGKGKSACPSVEYDRELFRTQLSELLQRLDLRESFHLVGFSFGGATAANFTIAHPDRVRTLSLIAPLFRFDEGNSVIRTARLPLIGGPFVRFVVLKKALQRASKLWAAAAQPTQYASAFQAQLQRPGFSQALLSFLRSDALRDYSVVYRELGGRERPAVLIWGTSDEDIPAQHIKQILALVPFIEYYELKDVTHGAVFQAAEQVNRLLLANFDKHSVA